MSADRLMLTEVATDLFRNLCTPEVVRAAEASGGSERLWAALAGSGFPHVSVPEAAGGSGGDLADACGLLTVAGRFAAPVPLAEAGMLAGWALAASGLPLPDGPATVAVGHRADVVRLSGAAGSWRVSGRLHRVPWGGRCERLVLLAEQSGQGYVLSVPTSSATVTGGRNLAGDPRDTLVLEAVELDDDTVSPAPDGVTSEALMLRGALSRAALIAGALARVRELTVHYTSRREQFGRPVSRFQAVQAHLVHIAEESALAGLAAEVAARNADPSPSVFDVAAAKITAGHAATKVCAASHQAHGALGMTREYELGQLSRRLWSWRDEFGSERHWSRAMGQHVAQAGADRLWPRIATGLTSG